MGPASEPGHGGRPEVGDPTGEHHSGPRHSGHHEGRGRGEHRGSERDGGKPEVERLHSDQRVTVTNVPRLGLSVVTGASDEAVLVSESVLVIEKNRGGVF